MPNWKKIALSGSNPEFSSLTVDGAIEASKFSGSFSGSYQGDGSELTGLTLSQVSTVSDTFTSATSKTVTHNFSTKNVIVQVYDNDDNIIIPKTVTTTDTNTVDITLDTSTTGRVVVAKGGHIVSGSVNFDNLSNKTEFQWRHILKPGELLIFNNWRILHGRGSFKGKRKMSGCYINMEDFESICKINNLY